MNLLKYISSFIWMLCSLGIIYAILRMITSVSKTDFQEMEQNLSYFDSTVHTRNDRIRYASF